MADNKDVKYEDSMLYRIRHSAAHVMAEAVLEEFPEGESRNWAAHRRWFLLRF